MTRFLLVLLLVAAPLEARVRAVRGEMPGAWLRRNALESLRTNARVVALGDATHGTHELYAAHVRMIKELVEQGVTTVAFEAPYAEFARIDEGGDPAELLRSHPYWFWDTQEVLDLMLWLRARNVRIAGIDASNVFEAAAYVVEKLRERDPELAAFAESQYMCLNSQPSEMCRSMIAEVRPRVPADLARAARIVEQGNEIREDLLGRRDQYLAENILALDGRVVVWGHNEHWGRLDYHLVDTTRRIRPAGAWLHDALGADYVAVGSVVLEGTFISVETTDRPRLAFLAMTPPSPNDWALLFDQAGRDELLVPTPPWPARPMRIAGSSVVSRQETMIEVMADLARKFDFVLYVRTSTPTQVRHWPVW